AEPASSMAPRDRSLYLWAIAAETAMTSTAPEPSGITIAAAGTTRVSLDPALTNRHGLITGATGTGKTVTLQVLAEGLSRAGVPVFAADIKGDLSGISAIGEAKDALVSRAKGL